MIVHRILVCAAAVGALILTFSACSSSSPSGCGTNGSCAQQAVYSYRCCRAHDVDRVLRAGQALALHWDSTAAGPTSQARAGAVRLSVDLRGPYRTVSGLKQSAGSATATLRAPILRLTTRSGGTPTSRLAIPAGTRPGYYDVHFSESDGGSSSSGDSVIRIAGAA